MNKLYRIFFLIVVSTILIFFGCENPTDTTTTTNGNATTTINGNATTTINGNATTTTNGNATTTTDDGNATTTTNDDDSTTTTNSGNGSIIITDLSVKDTNIRSLFISNITASIGASYNKFSGANKNVATRSDNSFVIQTLTYINSSGQNVPFFFVTPSGKNVVLNVESLKQLDNKRMIVDFNYFYVITIEGNVYTISDSISVYNYGSVLIDMEKNKLYDFSDYRYTGDKIVDNDLLFLIKSTTIYKIDLNNISTAIPLNNSQFDPVGYFGFQFLFGNKIIAAEWGTSSWRVFDINNNFTPKELQSGSLVLTEELLSSFGIEFEYDDEDGHWVFKYDYYNLTIPSNVIMQDLSGNIWTIGFNNFRWENNSDPFNRKEVREKVYFIGKLSIDDDGKFCSSDFSLNKGGRVDIIGGYSEDVYEFIFDSANNGRYMYYTDKCNSIMFLYNDKFITLKKKANGIDVAIVPFATPFTIPSLSDRTCFINKDNYLYYLEGKSIKRFYISATGTSETVYTNDRMITSAPNINYITATGSDLIFYQYAEDNITVNTLSLAMYKPNATPQIMASELVEIKSIVEFNF